MSGRVVFHIDFDYFYAQCEEIRTPRLKTKPVCVCMFSDRGKDSGAIATANYTARKYGVKSGIPIAFAKRMLEEREDAVFLQADLDYYSNVSESAMEIMQKNADVFEYVGRDEAYLDVTERVSGDFESAGHLAQQVKNSIRKSIKMSCSIGISPNKLLSKIASDHRKPNGLTVVLPDRVDEFLEPMMIKAIPGIGAKTERRLAEMDIKTVMDVRRLDVFTLNKEFGRRGGAFIYNAARGIDDEPVRERDPRVQYSRIITLKHDSKDYAFLHGNMARMCGEVHRMAVNDNQMFRSVGIHFVHSDLSNRSKSRMLRGPTSSLPELEKAAAALLREALEDQTDMIRRLGVRISELTGARGQSSITNYF